VVILEEGIQREASTDLRRRSNGVVWRIRHNAPPSKMHAGIVDPGSTPRTGRKDLTRAIFPKGRYLRSHTLTIHRRHGISVSLVVP
jgi:hypothetical protein